MIKVMENGAVEIANGQILIKRQGHGLRMWFNCEYHDYSVGVELRRVASALATVLQHWAETGELSEALANRCKACDKRIEEVDE